MAVTPGSKINFADQGVERVRRAHQNDLENILPFLFIAHNYIGTGPSPQLAINLIRTFTAARLTHTICYLSGIPQPSRGAAFTVGLAINIFMVAATIKHYLNF